ncbi:MAG: zf-HC2 domain-containing protein [Eubacterium sp.]|nr:zf-HC2 domain-containing protein [Eubacterium sp.]
MNHLEAQSYIMPFIEGRLPESKQLEFVMHMNTCHECHEELEIYYTLINGMQQLDKKEELTGNYPKDLENKLRKTQHQAKGRRRIRMSTFSVVTVGIVLIMILFYGRCLRLVYNYEQETKASMQGKYYFAWSIGRSIMDFPDRVQEEEDHEEDLQKATTVTMYDKISGYLELEKKIDGLWNIGESVARDTAGTYEPPEGESNEQTSDH